MESLPATSFAVSVLYRLLTHLNQTVECLPTSQDIECLHQTRVAIRRLRMAFWLFKDILPPQSRQWQRDIIRFSKTLASARDLDVQQVFLRQQLTVIPTELYGGLMAVLTLKAKSRQQKEKTLIKALKCFSKSGWNTKARKSLYESLTYFPEQTTYGLLAPRIVSRIKLIQSPAGAIEDMSVDELHELRKNIRYLRYGLDIFNHLDPEQSLKTVIKPLKGLQEILGEIHDSDIWLETLATYLKTEERHMDRYLPELRPALAWLTDNRLALREETFTAFRQKWKALIEQDFWTGLIEQIADLSD